MYSTGADGITVYENEIIYVNLTFILHLEQSVLLCRINAHLLTNQIRVFHPHCNMMLINMCHFYLPIIRQKVRTRIFILHPDSQTSLH